MSGFFSFLLGHGHTWASKLIYVSILFTLWGLFVEPQAEGIKVLMLWLANQTIYQVLSQETCEYIEDTITLIASIKIVMWIITAEPDKANEH